MLISTAYAQASGGSLLDQSALVQFLPLVLIYLRLRGLTWNEIQTSLGLLRGRGFMREIFAGIVGYIAGLPLLVIANVMAPKPFARSTPAMAGCPFRTSGYPHARMPFAMIAPRPNLRARLLAHSVAGQGGLHDNGGRHHF